MTFFEPSLVPSHAWANTFSFGTCAKDDRTGAIEVVLRAFAQEQLGPGRL